MAHLAPDSALRALVPRCRAGEYLNNANCRLYYAGLNFLELFRLIISCMRNKKKYCAHIEYLGWLLIQLWLSHRQRRRWSRIRWSWTWWKTPTAWYNWTAAAAAAGRRVERWRRRRRCWGVPHWGGGECDQWERWFRDDVNWPGRTLRQVSARKQVGGLLVFRLHSFLAAWLQWDL